MSAINKLADGGMHFWDYGNAFLLEASRAGLVAHTHAHTHTHTHTHTVSHTLCGVGADLGKPGAPATEFRYPSYVQHIMGSAQQH